MLCIFSIILKLYITYYKSNYIEITWGNFDQVKVDACTKYKLINLKHSLYNITNQSSKT
jgi:hypothetical protein